MHHFDWILVRDFPACAEVWGNLKDCKLGGWVVLLVGLIMLWESVRVARMYSTFEADPTDVSFLTSLKDKTEYLRTMRWNFQ